MSLIAVFYKLEEQLGDIALSFTCRITGTWRFESRDEFFALFPAESVGRRRNRCDVPYFEGFLGPLTNWLSSHRVRADRLHRRTTWSMRKTSECFEKPKTMFASVQPILNTTKASASIVKLSISASEVDPAPLSALAIGFDGVNSKSISDDRFTAFRQRPITNGTDKTKPRVYRCHRMGLTLNNRCATARYVANQYRPRSQTQTSTGTK